MKNSGLEKPIFIIAGVRSGTTMLGDILSKHKDVAYWIEPKYIWQYRKPGKTSDFRPAEDATASVSRYIQRQFFQFTADRGKKRFLEKTPSNVFRVGFINEIFPDALFIHLIRSGISSSLSAEKKWLSRPKRSALKRRLFNNEIPLRDLPYYFTTIAKEVVWKFFRPQKGSIWGQKFEGMQEYRASHSLIETCAKQWSEGLRVSQAELDKIDSQRIFTIKYEHILGQPDLIMGQLMTFLGLSHSVSVVEYAQKIVRSTAKEYTPEEQEKIKLIQPIIAEQMKRYNYV